ncbi:hypothetical protein [Ligilactobacillus salivarius]|uniref:hypothetical protein n=1 Tax=Ligilactobacillus salivarius TaxID=1624 RepID=UPI0022E37166|nr:hypothetical protein [Ligilactobacillus salivarius]
MNNKPTFDTLVKSWKELNQDKQRKEYNFIKVDRNFIQNNDYTTTQKGLYLLLLCLSKPITTNERYVSVNVNDLITYVTPSKDTRTKRNTKELLLTTLMELQEHEIISYDGMINDNINVYINTDVTPFTKLYEIDALQALDKMTTSRADTTLTLYAAYAFVYVSVGNGKVKNKGIYIHGLTYMSNCLDVEYRTLQRYLDELVGKQFIVKKDYMESKNKKKVVISLYNDIDIERLGQYIAKKTTKSKKDNKQQEQEQQQDNINTSDDTNTSDDKDKQETTDNAIIDNETLIDNDKDNKQDNTNTSDDKEQEKRLRTIKDYTDLDDESVKLLSNAWKEYSTELVDWNLSQFEDAYEWFTKHKTPSMKHAINWLKKTFDDTVDDTRRKLEKHKRDKQKQKELLNKMRERELIEQRNRPKESLFVPYKERMKEKERKLKERQKTHEQALTPKFKAFLDKMNETEDQLEKQGKITLDDNPSDYSYYEMKNRPMINKYLPQEQKEKKFNAILDRVSEQEQITRDDNDKDNKQKTIQDYKEPQEVEIIKQREQELIELQQEQEFADGVELTPEEQDKALDELLGL